MLQIMTKPTAEAVGKGTEKFVGLSNILDSELIR